MSGIRFLLVGMILCLALAGCAGGPERAASPAPGNPAPAGPPSAATILVPTGDAGLARTLRQTLSGRGWHLQNYNQHTTRGQRTDYQNLARQARYRLTLDTRTIGACRDGSKSFEYQLALIENATGRVPVSMSGADCLDPIVRQFNAHLDRRGLSASGG